MRYGFVVVLVPLLAGCTSTEQQEAQPVVAVPLELDPTDQYELASWWANGEQLLYLAESGFYALYEGTNRYRTPVERGKWWQLSYAALSLEPYAELRQPPTRVAIRKIAGERTLKVHELRPMLALDGPPQVLEDRLIGRWSGGLGTLRLDRDTRYVFSPRRALEGAAARLAAHRGTWRVAGDALRLQPDSPSMEPIELAVQDGDEAIVLTSPDGELRRRPPDAEAR